MPETEPVRAAQKLLIGPWAHLFPYTSPTSTGTGEIDFGSAALVDLHETQLRWFDHWLKGVDTGILDEPPVRIFVMGDNRWRDEQEWPLARTRYTPYYLGGGGRANTADGDGTLGPACPARMPPTTSSTTPRIPCRRAAAIRSSSPWASWTSARWRRAPTCSSTRARRWRPASR